MSIGGTEDTHVEKWLLDTSKYAPEIRKAAGELRKQNKAAKDAALLQEAMAKSMGKVEGHLGSMGRQMLTANLASAALAKGLGLIKQQMGDLIERGLTWNDWIGDSSAALDGMSQAAAGIIGKLDLVRARTKLATGDFQASEQQMQAMAKAAVLYSRVVKVDLRTAMDKLSDSAVLGRDKPLRQLGIDIELLGTKTEKTQNFLEVLEERFGGITVKADNANEKIQQTEAALSDATGALGHAIIKSDLFQGALDAISRAAKGVAGDLRAATKEASAFATGGALNLILGAGPAEGVQNTILAAAAARHKVRGYKEDYAAAVAAGPQMPVKTGRLGDTKRGGGRKGSKSKSGFKAEAMGPDRALFDAAEELALKRQLVEVEQALAAARAEEAYQQKINSGIVADSNKHVARAVAETQALVEQANAADATLAGFATGGLSQFAGGIWSAVDAAVLGKASFGEAMAQMAKAAIMSIASQATVEAMMETGRGIAALATTWGVPNPKATNHFIAAGVFAGIGTASGLAGVGMSAAGVGASSGSSGGSGASSRTSGGGSYRPATGGSRRSEQQTYSPTINVYLDAQNPAAGLHWQKLQARN